MKDWQHNYDLEYLKNIETRYSKYNEYALSPFSEMKKHIIAEELYKGSLKFEYGCTYIETIVHSDSSIRMFEDVIIGQKVKGDKVITNFVWEDVDSAKKLLLDIKGPCWLRIWTEDIPSGIIAAQSGFSEVGTKVTSFAELFTWYFKDSISSLFSRQHPKIMKEEEYTLRKVKIADIPIQPLIDALPRISMNYTDHYSNYNEKHSWSALSFRGYTSDPAFITKPQEMNKKWNEEHKNISFRMQDTSLRLQVKELEPVINILPGNKHRIRLMKLSPNGGTLERHTDQVDKDSGVADGKVMRFHFPLITNDHVKFWNWGITGYATVANMKIGECWYIDTRKPHRAVNEGKSYRIHLVVDVEANEKLREIIGD